MGELSLMECLKHQIPLKSLLTVCWTRSTTQLVKARQEYSLLLMAKSQVGKKVRFASTKAVEQVERSRKIISEVNTWRYDLERSIMALIALVARNLEFLPRSGKL